MGSNKRADEFAAVCDDPILTKVVKRLMSGCGNCGRRIQCSNKIIDIKRAIEFFGDDTEPALSSSLIARNIAKIFLNKCAKCDRLSRCVDYWLESCGETEKAEQVRSYLYDLVNFEEGLASYYIQAILDDQGLTTSKLLRKLAALWFECDKEKKYWTAVSFLSQQ